MPSFFGRLHTIHRVLFLVRTFLLLLPPFPSSQMFGMGTKIFTCCCCLFSAFCFHDQNAFSTFFPEQLTSPFFPAACNISPRYVGRGRNKKGVLGWENNQKAQGCVWNSLLTPSCRLLDSASLLFWGGFCVYRRICDETHSFASPLIWFWFSFGCRGLSYFLFLVFLFVLFVIVLQIYVLMSRARLTLRMTSAIAQEIQGTILREIQRALSYVVHDLGICVLSPRV